MANTLRLEVVTPLGMSYADDVQMVVIPGAEGELGIYPMHIPLVTDIKIGALKILKDGVESDFAVGEGFAEITATQVTVLTDMAVNIALVDEHNVEKAVERAQEALRHTEAMSSEEIAATQASLQKSLIQLKLKRRGK